MNIKIGSISAALLGLVLFLPVFSERSAGSFPEQRLVIEANIKNLASVKKIADRNILTNSIYIATIFCHIFIAILMSGITVGNEIHKEM